MPILFAKSKKLFIPTITALGLILILTGLFNLTGMFNHDNTNSDDNPLILWAPQTIQAQSNCDITVSPGGLAGGISSIQAGQTLCLRDGTYYESLSISKSGTASNPITIRAVNDGKVTIDGQNSRVSGRITGNYITVEEIVFRNSSGSVVYVNGDNNIFRRCSAYYGRFGGNDHVWEVTGVDNLIEDCVGAAAERHIFHSWNDDGISTHNIFRRCFAVGTVPGKSETTTRTEYNLYGASDDIVENSIGWGGTEYASISIHSASYTPNYKCQNNKVFGSIFLFSGKDVSADPGLGTLISLSGGPENPKNNRIYNSIIYGNNYGVRITSGVDSTTIDHCTIMNSSHYGLSSENSSDVIKNTLIYNNSQGFSSAQGSFSYINSYGNSSRNTPPSGCQNCSTINPGNIGLTIPSNSPMHGAGENGSDIGANICYRYIDGVLHDGKDGRPGPEPLWDWPMQDRIKAELGIDVMAELEQMFGPIPAECKGAQVDRPSITLTKQANPTQVSSGQIITYTIHYKNTGQAAADTVVIKDVIPDGISYVSGSASHNAIYINNTLEWNIGIVGAGSDGSVSFGVRVD